MEHIILFLLTALAFLIVVLRIKSIRLSYMQMLLKEEQEKRNSLMAENQKLHCKIEQLKRQQPFLFVTHKTEKAVGT